MASRPGVVSLANFAAAARGVGGTSSAVEHTILPDTSSPGVALTELFPLQSYLDDTLLEKALLIQTPNEPIVRSTLKIANVGGYTFGLHPSSQTPVAVRPIVGGQTASPQAVILRPGQIYRPHGRPDNKTGNFSGIEWGLPYGWLGGGVATLYVFPSADADVAWPGDAEVMFHRFRARITTPAALAGLAAALNNWPLRFPWTQAVRGAASISQKGASAITITNPTRVMMSLRLNALATAGDMRMILQGSDDLDTGTLALPGEPGVGCRFDTYTWGTYAANGGAGNLATNYPVIEYTGPLVRLGSDGITAAGAALGGMVFVDMSSGSLTEAYVDIARYGRI